MRGRKTRYANPPYIGDTKYEVDEGTNGHFKRGYMRDGPDAQWDLTSPMAKPHEDLYILIETHKKPERPTRTCKETDSWC